MGEKEGEQAYSPRRAKRKVNSFWDHVIISTRRHMDTENRRKENGKLQTWPHSCSVTFVQNYWKSRTCSSVYPEQQPTSLRGKQLYQEQAVWVDIFLKS
jgi:hypothetical protein